MSKFKNQKLYKRVESELNLADAGQAVQVCDATGAE